VLFAQTERDQRTAKQTELTGELERKLSSVLDAQTERDRRTAQLSDQLEQKLTSILAAQSERDRRTAQLTDELERKLSAVLFAQTEGDRRTARLTEELPELQATLDTKLDKLLQSRDHALEQAQSALEKATSRAAEANEQTRRELAELRAELEARMSEMAAVHLRPKDTESSWAKGKAEAGPSFAKTDGNLLNADEDGVVHGLAERLRALESVIVSGQWNEKNFEMMECTNEG